ncbi:MAG: F0F1 ATP synthase subunit B' [Pseudomonadota bacterium]
MSAESDAIEAMEHGSSGLPQLDFNTWPSQIIWTAAALWLLYYLLNNYALPRISGILEERADAVADDLDRAEEFEMKAQEASGAYDQALADARSKAQAIAAETRAEIQKEVDAAMAKADAEISARAAESEKRIGEIQAEATANVEAVAKDTAVALVAKFLPELQDQGAVDAAVTSRI